MSTQTRGAKHQQEPIKMRPKLSDQAAREVRRDTPLRRARTCYGHLAGVAGVALMDRLISLGWLEEDPRDTPSGRAGYRLSRQGLQAMELRGVDVSAAAKPAGNFAFGCLDWTERREHLGGALGRAVTNSLSEQGLAVRTPGAREVTLKGNLEGWLDGAAPQG